MSMERSISFEVAGSAPSVNSAYYFIRKGKRTIKVKSTKAKQWIKEVITAFFEAYEEYDIIDNDLCPVFSDGDLIVELTFWFNDKRRHDIDNYQKLTIDALTGLLWKDDNQIVELVSKKYSDTNYTKTCIKVKRRGDELWKAVQQSL